jgi:cytochrome c553
MTHLPTGLVIGAFLFVVGARALRRPNLALTGRHCIALALITLFPTMLLGFLDWQHFYAGAWIFPIKMKLGLASLLLVLLLGADIQGRSVQRKSRGFPFMYVLCALNVVALGYYGGELVFGARTAAESGRLKEKQVSAAQFTAHCSSCHPQGGNAIKPGFPLRSAPQLSDFPTFLAYIRSPKARGGSETVMPSFPPEKLTDEQAKEIYDYVTTAFQKR